MGVYAISPNGAMIVGVVVGNPATGQTVQGVGRVDTGADTTLIDPTFVAPLGLIPTGTTPIQGVLGSPTAEPDYIAGVTIPGAGSLAAVGMTADPLRPLGYDVLVGLDILSTGTLRVDWQAGTFALVFGQQSPARPAQRAWVPVLLGALAITAAGVVVGVSQS